MRIMWFCLMAVSLLSTESFGSPSDSLVEYLTHLRSMTGPQRTAMNESSNYQARSQELKRINDEVLRPLLEGDLREFVPTLHGALSDPDPYIREYAGQLVTMAAANPEISTLGLPITPRRKAAIVLAKDLLTAPTESDERVRRSFVHALARMGHLIPQESVRVYDALLNDQSEAVRLEALLGIAWIPGEQKRTAQEAIRMLRGDISPQNRKAAASVLAEPVYQDNNISQDLVGALVRERDGDVQNSTIQALVTRTQFDPSAIRALTVAEGAPNLAPTLRAEIERARKGSELK